MAQVYRETPRTDTVFFMTPDEIKNIPHDRTVTYAQIIVDYRPHKKDPNRVCITVGRNLITYPGELTTQTAVLVTTKFLWESTINIPGAKFSMIDCDDFYLTTHIDR